MGIGTIPASIPAALIRRPTTKRPLDPSSEPQAKPDATGH